VSGVVDVVWFGYRELYEGSTSSAGEDKEGMEDAKERTEAAEEPDREDIDMVVCWSSTRNRTTLGKKRGKPGEPHIILQKPNLTPGDGFVRVGRRCVSHCSV
jgi:hypothetical protein